MGPTSRKAGQPKSLKPGNCSQPSSLPSENHSEGQSVMAQWRTRDVQGGAVGTAFAMRVCHVEQ